MPILGSRSRLRKSQLHPQSISLSLYQVLHGPRLLGFLVSAVWAITVEPPGISLVEIRSRTIASQGVYFGNEAGFEVAAFLVGNVLCPAAAGAEIVIEPAHL